MDKRNNTARKKLLRPRQRFSPSKFVYWHSRVDGFRNRSNFKDLQSYCLFLGNPRSGSTLLGALLDAHPEIIISTELDVFPFIKAGYQKEQLFSLILRRSEWFANTGSKWEGYSYKVRNQSPGKFTQLRIIGDKKAAKSALHLQESPNLLANLHATVELPIYIIHVVRNPFDNITTMAQKRNGSLKNAANFYFSICDTVKEIQETQYGNRIITVHLENVISNPQHELSKICQNLNISCQPAYLEDCQNSIFRSPRKTREKIDWPEDMIKMIEAKSKDYPFIENYTFAN